MSLLQTLSLQINANKFICDREAKALVLKGPVDFIEGEDGCDKRIEEYMKNKARIAESSEDKKAFDVCIMNPPYDRNLHLKILEKVIQYAEETINISPCTWAAKHNINKPMGKWRQKFDGKIKSFEFIDHRESNDIFGFGDILENLAIIHFVPEGGDFDIINYGFDNKLEKSIFDKLDIVDKGRKDKDVMTFSKAMIDERYGSVNGSSWGQPNRFARKEFDVPVYAWHGGDNCYDAVVMSKERAEKKVSMTMRFDNEKQRQNFLESLKTTFMDYYYKKFVDPGNCKNVVYMFRFADYTHSWDNKRFCDYFNITGYISDTEAEPGSEWEEILNTMKKYK